MDIKKALFITVIITRLLILPQLLSASEYSSSISEFLCELGISYYNEGNIEEASREFTNALRLSPNNSTAEKYLKTIALKENLSQENSLPERNILSQPQLQAYIRPLEDKITYLENDLKLKEAESFQLRQELYARIKLLEEMAKEKEALLKDKSLEISQRESQLAKVSGELREEKEQGLLNLQGQNRLKDLIAKKEQELGRIQSSLSAELGKLNILITEKEAIIQDKDSRIRQLTAEARKTKEELVLAKEGARISGNENTVFKEQAKINIQELSRLNAALNSQRELFEKLSEENRQLKSNIEKSDIQLNSALGELSDMKELNKKNVKEKERSESAARISRRQLKELTRALFIKQKQLLFASKKSEAALKAGEKRRAELDSALEQSNLQQAEAKNLNYEYIREQKRLNGLIITQQNSLEKNSSIITEQQARLDNLAKESRQIDSDKSARINQLSRQLIRLKDELAKAYEYRRVYAREKQGLMDSAKIKQEEINALGLTAVKQKKNIQALIREKSAAINHKNRQMKQLSAGLYQAEERFASAVNDYNRLKADLNSKITALEEGISLKNGDIAKLNQEKKDLLFQRDAFQARISEQAGKLTNLKDSFQEQLLPEIISNEVDLDLSKDALTINISADALFDSIDPQLSPRGSSILKTIAGILLVHTDNKILIEGHTDNTPIKYSNWKSNWNLSCARALSALNDLVSNGLSPQRFVISGYGEFKPVTDNTTISGRKQNRRVSIIIQPHYPRILPFIQPGPRP